VLLLDDGLLAAAGFPDLARRAPDHVCFAEGVRTRFGRPTSNQASAPPTMSELR
jgi:hypothetical protein